MSDELEPDWGRDTEGCWFDRADHEGELRSYRVERGDLHMLVPTRQRSPEGRWGFEGHSARERPRVSLCERHAAMLGAEPS